MHCKLTFTFLFFTYLLLLYVWPDTRPVVCSVSQKVIFLPLLR